MTTYVVSRKRNGVRWYAAENGWPTQDWAQAATFSTVEEARAAMADWVWPVVEVQCDHETGEPFVWFELPGKEAA